MDNFSIATLTNCTISGNSVGFFGGGGLYIHGVGTTKLRNCTVSDNSAPYGGGLYVNGESTATLTICTVSGNSAIARGWHHVQWHGTLTICTVSGNQANAGGGILMEGGGASPSAIASDPTRPLALQPAVDSAAPSRTSSSSGTLTVTNSTFDDNEAIAVGPNDPIVSPSYIFAAGGAIDLNLASTGSATITTARSPKRGARRQPRRSAGGGAISNSSDAGATLTVTDCTLGDNAAIGAAGGDGTTNYGSGQGGGINSIGTLTVIDSTLSDNLAQARLGSGRRPLAGSLEQQCDRRRRHLLPRPLRRPRADC